MCIETEFESYKALLVVVVSPISRLAPHDFACRWKDGLVGTSTAAHYHPTSTKAKYPSSQTETMCIETEFESYKALVPSSPTTAVKEVDGRKKARCVCDGGLARDITRLPTNIQDFHRCFSYC
eukprot:scaffold27145_cov83-Skeletonema_dohrnii-CCMP3373.AAC.1